jgi:hypothetical protein
MDWLFRTSIGETIKSYVILDRDYRSENTISEIERELSLKNVNVHIWQRKEIENYVINFEVIYRVFDRLYKQRNPTSETPLSITEFTDELLRIMNDFKSTVYSQLTAEEIKNRPDKAKDVSGVIETRYSDFERQWKDINYRLRVIPGKDFLACLNQWLGENYHLSISVNTVLSNMKSNEVDPEVAGVIKEFTALLTMR